MRLSLQLDKIKTHRVVFTKYTFASEIDLVKRNQSSEKMKAGIDAFETHDALMVTDAQANIIRVNKAFETIAGYSRDEVLGKNPRILKSGRHSNSFYLDLWQRLLRDGFWSGEVWDKHKNGEIFPKHLTITAIKNAEGITIEYVASFLNITDHKKDEIELYKFRDIINSSDDAIISKSLDGIIETWNRGAEKMFGYTASEAIGNSMMILLSPDQMHEEDNILALIKLGKKVDHYETVRHRKDGQQIDISTTISPIFDDQGKVIGASNISRDISLRKKIDQMQHDSEHRVKTILDNLFTYVALLDLEGKVLEVNKAPLVRAGIRYEDVVGQFFYNAPWWSYDDTVRSQLIEAIEAARLGKSSRYDVTVKMGNDLVPIDFQISPIYGGDGKIFGILPTAVDITDRKQLEENIRYMAYYDVLTQLPNRRLLIDRLNQLMVGKKRSGLYGALLFIDLDNFKPMNDVHGHEAGDFLLIEVGKRITSCLREMDTVARIGGDEFVALIGQLQGDKSKALIQAKAIAEKVLLALSEPYRITIAHGQEAGLTIEHHCTASIGVAVFSGKVTDPEVILSMADVAMYEAKEAGRNQVKLNSSVI